MSRPEDKMFETQSGRFANVIEPSEVTTAAVGALGAAAVTSANATPAAEDPPTKAEFDAVVALANELKATVNALRTDVAAVRTTLNSLIDTLNG